MNKGGERTTGPKSRTNRCGDASARCSASNRPRPLSPSFPCTPVYTCFNLQRNLVSRRTLRTFRAQARADWQAATAAA
jgi:hypothetical protein